MSNKVSSRVLLGVFAIAIVAAGWASTAHAEVVAFWEFNGSNFLADSSGNGHTLTATGTVSQVSDAASFTQGILSPGNLNLTSYRKLAISWDQTSALPTGSHILFEHSINYGLYTGGLITYQAAAAGTAGILTKFSPTPTTYNIDDYTAATGLQSYRIEYDLNATVAGDVVKVYQGSTLIGTNNTGANKQTLGPSSFVNMVFNVGNRSGNAAGTAFVGTIDNFKIEGVVPEPGTVVLLLTGLISMVAYAWRNRK